MSTRIAMMHAAAHLARSERGTKALVSLLDMLDTYGLAMDAANQRAFLVLLHAAWSTHPGSAREIIRDALHDLTTPPPP